MSKLDPQIVAHLEWLGFVRPTGLVVSAPALVQLGAILDQRDAEGQRLFRSCLVGDRSENLRIADFVTFASTVLDWRFSPKGYAGTLEFPVPPELEAALDDGSVLRPDFAVRELEPQSGAPGWQLLVRVVAANVDFDREASGGGSNLSPHSRMERLLRKTGISAGLLVNGSMLRLISAPRGESSGWLDFRVADMMQTAGRPICTAMRLLLSEQRLLALPRQQRLAALLAKSREFQNEVSERLSEQVLQALYELLRGFQAAHDASKGELLREVLAEHPDEVYRGLLTVILRLVFLLYAEERDMLPEDATFLRYYSIAGLHERLREDAALFPDTMDQRYGAWAQLVSLFRIIHDGANASEMRLPARHGVLFDPDRFKFLEGRRGSGARQIHERIDPPLVPDGTIYRALEKLLVLNGERISYRALDVEQIGSVYETMMGFRLETATGRSVAVRSQKKQGAPTAVDLDALLAEVGSNRAKSIQDQADRKLTDSVKKQVAAANTVDELHAALLPVIDQAATPDLVPRGAMVLQPSEARRRSGSHYTPRELTEPIVRTTLDPILSRLREADGSPPGPNAILDLKVCDPAMGSGAFLVEACRYLGDALVESWRAHNVRPDIPFDEDEVVFARRLVAQRSLYGVDRNSAAVDLAKMSLWLVTLAKDHALTFIDHALRHGDSLLGLSRPQLEAFHWDNSAPPVLRGLGLRDAIDKVADLRQRIREAGENVSDWERRDLWDEAQFELRKVRFIADLAVAAFFQSEKPKEREAKRVEFARAVLTGTAEAYRHSLEELRHADRPVAPFHWQIEFPEVFERERPGFDALVGNPPFLGGGRISSTLGGSYLNWILALHEETQGSADIVAHFFRRAFNLLRENGVLGFIATNTIAQGDTRVSGLRWICTHGGEIFNARRRVKWPGSAAVVVSVVQITKGRFDGAKQLDGREVDVITAFLFHLGDHEDPVRLLRNASSQFEGAKITGMGFTFDDADTKGVATPIGEMKRLLHEHPEYSEVISPYIGGDEVNTSPTHAHHRYVINFGERGEDECRRRWPQLMAIVEKKVKPERLAGRLSNVPWWLFERRRPELQAAIARLERVLVISRVTEYRAFTFLNARMVFSERLVVVSLEMYAAFATLQSRAIDVWTDFVGTTHEERRMFSSKSFETFPFPENWQTHSALETAGRDYHSYRAALLVRNDEGLTTTYNRFHDPEERDPDIMKLRELHAALDRAVLDAYGWSDLSTDCEFLLDYEIDEEEWGDKKKPYRYRWPNDVRDEILGRLLELNTERARAELRSGAVAKKKRGKKRGAQATPAPDADDLFS